MNLYVHFPFCRNKCSYCTLYSRPGATEGERAAYVRRLTAALDDPQLKPVEGFDTIYFGGGSPGLCDLSPLLAGLSSRVAVGAEFTVELHPLDVTADLLQRLKEGGVNRISMGVQSLDDDILRHMGRGYTFAEAERAFALVRTHFDNAGIDLIVGYPGETAALLPRHARLAKWGLRHCSVYSLQNERHLVGAIDDDVALDRIAVTAAFLKDIGLARYEISNYACPGFECRHNLAVWRGEDYIGLGAGACGRIGLKRTRNFLGRGPAGEGPSSEGLAHGLVGGPAFVEERVDAETDEKERTIFRLRTREGLDASRHPEWADILGKFVQEGILTREGFLYFLTPRGTEVCDAVLAELV